MAIPVKLPVFEGPLDLLLHLIEKNKIDIYDIPIAGITDQYLEYVRQMDHEDLDVTSEFLVMAATLLDIKSRMLLPREKDDETGEEEGDPREELVRRLLEYKMYKYLSEELAVYREQAGVRYFRAQKLPREVLNYRPPINYDELLGDADLQSLQKIFGEVLRRKKSRRDPIRGGFGKIRREEISLDNKTLYIRAYLQAHPRTDFRALLESRESREEVIVTFLIILELMKTQKVHIVQDSIGGAILIEAGVPENTGASPEDTPSDTSDTQEYGSGEPVDSSSAAFESSEAFETTDGELQGDGSKPVSPSPEAVESFKGSDGELEESSIDLSADSPVPTEASSPPADIRDASAAASRTVADASAVDMPLTAFHRMEIVTSVFTPEGLLPESAHVDNSQTGNLTPDSGSRNPAIDNTEAVFAENFSPENSLSDNLLPVEEIQCSPIPESVPVNSIIPMEEIQDNSVSESEPVNSIFPVGEIQDSSVSESEPVNSIFPVEEIQDNSVSEGDLVNSIFPVEEIQDNSVSQGDQPVPAISESTLSNDADTGLEQTDSSEEADSGPEKNGSSGESDLRPAGEHFSAHLWCKDPCCRTRYFRSFSGKADISKIQPPGQWTRARMTRLWARRFF